MSEMSTTLNPLAIRGRVGQTLSDNEKDKTYVLIEPIGRGASSQVWTASSTTKMKPDVIIKEILKSGNYARLTFEEFQVHVRREYLIARYINSALAVFCVDNAVCAEGVFFLEPEDRKTGFYAGYIVFPYSDTTSLAKHMQTTMARRLDDAKEVLDYQLEALYISTKLLLAVGKMHAIDVYHRDIKPENIVVTVDPNTNRVNEVLLIDFGMSCTTVAAEYFRGLGYKEFEGSCTEFALDQDNNEVEASFYRGTAIYRDPQASEGRFVDKLWLVTEPETLRGFRPANIDYWFKKFDRYSVATVIQLLFDREQFRKRSVLHRIEARRAKLFPMYTAEDQDGGMVLKYIKEMQAPSTGMREMRMMPRGVLDYAVFFENLVLYFERLQKMYKEREKKKT